MPETFIFLFSKIKSTVKKNTKNLLYPVNFLYPLSRDMFALA